MPHHKERRKASGTRSGPKQRGTRKGKGGNGTAVVVAGGEPNSTLSATSWMTACLVEMRTAAETLKAAMDSLMLCFELEAPPDASCASVLTFFCPSTSPPQTPEDVVAMERDEALITVAQHVLEGRGLLHMMHSAVLPGQVTPVSKCIAVLLQRTDRLELPYFSCMLLESTVRLLVRNAVTAEDAAWVGCVVSLGRRNLAVHRYDYDYNCGAAQPRAGRLEYQASELRDTLLALSAKATTGCSAKWAAAAFRAVLGQDNCCEFMVMHFATAEVRDALLRLALVSGPGVVEQVSGALRLLASVVEGRRCLQCVEVRDAVVVMATSITPAAAVHVMQLIASMRVSVLSDDERQKLAYRKWLREITDDVADPALRQFFTPELCAAFLGLVRRSLRDQRWFDTAATTLCTLTTDPSDIAKLFHTVLVRDTLLDLIGRGNHRKRFARASTLSECLSRLPHEILKRPLLPTAAVRDALVLVAKFSRRTAVHLFEAVVIEDFDSQTLFGTVKVRDALLKTAADSSPSIAARFLLKLVKGHAANQALFRCVALRDAFVQMTYWSDAVVDIMICLLEGDDTATTLFGTAAVRDAIVSWYRGDDRPAASLRLRLLTLLTGLTANEAANQALFATPAIHNLLLQLAATEGCGMAAAGVLGKLRHSVEVTFDIDGRAAFSGYVLDGVSMAAPMGAVCFTSWLRKVSLDGLEGLAGSDGEFLSGAASLRCVVALDALEAWRGVGDGFLRGCASLRRLCL